ncbi:hypothetical protein Tco_0996916 [Tanacetum coccineum]
MEAVKKSIDERVQHKRKYDRRVNKRLMETQESKAVSSIAVDVDLVVMESNRPESKKQDTSSRSGNYLIHVVDADIRPVNDQMPFAEINSNTTPDSTYMSHRGGEIDQDAGQYQVKSPLLNAELFKMKDMVEKEVYNELSNRFLQLKKHCISLEISIQQKEESFKSNKPCKNQDSPEFREFFEINQLKAQLQAKNSTINNLKKKIKNVHEKSNEAKIFKGYRISSNKSSAVHEKPNTPRSCLRWKPTGRIFKIAGLRWIPTGKMFTDSTTKVDSEPINGLNDYITNPYECNQTLNVSACTLNLSADNTLGPAPQRKEKCMIQCALSSKEEKSSRIANSGEVVEASKRRRSLLDHKIQQFQRFKEGSGIIPEVPDEPKDNSGSSSSLLS